MVTFQQLRNAKPGMFATAADDWLKLAKEAEAAAENIHESGGKALAKNWADAVGDKAKNYCQRIAGDFQASGSVIRSVVKTLDALATAVESAKRELDSAVEFATKNGLEVDGNGKVTVPQGVTDPQAAERAKQAGWLIQDAVNDATRSDNEAAASLRKFVQSPSDIMRRYQVAESGMVNIPGLGDITTRELSWINKLGPLGALKVDKIKNEALAVAAQQGLTGGGDGRQDAFRHAYWSARMTQEFGAEWTKGFTTAHESEVGNPAAREAMDLYNNEVGRKIALAHPDAGPEELARHVREAVQRGDTVVVTGDGRGVDYSTPGTNATGADEKQRAGGGDAPYPERDDPVLHRA